MHDNAAARLAAQGDALARRLDRTGERIDELQRELAEERVTWRSDDELYSVAVDGNGRLLDLDIAARALHSAHASRIGRGIVEAIGSARAAAVEVGRRRWKEEFGSTSMLDGLLPEPEESDDDRPRKK